MQGFPTRPPQSLQTTFTDKSCTRKHIRASAVHQYPCAPACATYGPALAVSGREQDM